MDGERNREKMVSGEIELNRSEKKFRVLFERSPVGMAMVDNATGKFLEANPSLLQSVEYSKEEFLQLSFGDITPREYDAQEMDQVRSLQEKGCFGPNEKEYIRKNGSRYPIKISGFLLTDVDGREVVWALIEDVSEQKTLEEKMRRLALYDPLTGLANRRLLSERIEQSTRYADRNQTKVGFLVIDLDNFKFVNDNFGHVMGDSLLKAISVRLKDIKHRKSDTIARIGGDEFVILLPEIHQVQDVEKFAGMVVSKLNQQFVVKEQVFTISASIGISLYPDHANDELSLIKAADSALYQVKNNQKNGYKTFDK